MSRVDALPGRVTGLWRDSDNCWGSFAGAVEPATADTSKPHITSISLGSGSTPQKRWRFEAAEELMPFLT